MTDPDPAIAESAPETAINRRIAALHGLTAAGPVVSEAPLVPGIWFSLDPEGTATGDFDTAPGQLLTARFTDAGPGRWLALQLVLGDIDLTGRHVLGLVLRSAAPQTITFRACLRSGEEGGFSDHFFPRHVVSFEETTVHVDLLELDSAPTLPRVAPWRDLILFFKPQSFAVTLHDMRVFLL